MILNLKIRSQSREGEGNSTLHSVPTTQMCNSVTKDKAIAILMLETHAWKFKDYYLMSKFEDK